MNTGRLLAWLVLPIVGLVVAGMVGIWLLKAVLGLAVYVIVGAVVVGGGLYLYGKAKRSLAPGTRNRNRIEAAYRTRNQG
jgi:hypothetical protein